MIAGTEAPLTGRSTAATTLAVALPASAAARAVGWRILATATALRAPRAGETAIAIALGAIAALATLAEAVGAEGPALARLLARPP